MRFITLISLLCLPLGAAQPIITAVSPINGSSTGGSSITITGSGFNGATAVDFGTVAAA